MTGFACRSCGSREIRPVLSLGPMPLANGLLSADQLGTPEARYPLDLVFCSGCSLVQITETVPPSALFGTYMYRSSVSESFVRHARELTDRLTDTRKLGPGSLVVEIASNDGYLLQHYAARRVPVLGMNPAQNIAEVARRERGIPTLPEFFTRDLARRLHADGCRPDVIHAHNVLAHVADLNGFVEGLALLLQPGSVAVVEVPYVRDLADRLEFDTIYHEHLCYFSLTALSRLFVRHGLSISEVEHLPVHGGSLRLFVIAGTAAQTAEAAVRRALDEEAAAGVHGYGYYRDLSARVVDLTAALRGYLNGLKSQGYRLAGYGAGAKTTVLLNSLELEPGVLEFVVDRSPVKQGKFIPGARVPIRPTADLLTEAPDYAVLFTWNLADEIVEQQAEYRRRGGRFIRPLPQVTVV